MPEENKIEIQFQPKNKLEAQRFMRKKKIIDETKALVLERGINNELMSEIAKRSDISRQRLYKYYNDIEDILQDILISIRAESDVFFLMNISDSDNDPISIIRQTVLSLPNISEKEQNNLLFLALYNVYYSIHSPDKRRSFNDNLYPFNNQISAGQESGLFRTDKTVKQLSAVITQMLSAFSFYAVMNGNKNSDLYQEDALNAIADAIISFLSKK